MSPLRMIPRAPTDAQVPDLNSEFDLNGRRVAGLTLREAIEAGIWWPEGVTTDGADHFVIRQLHKLNAT